MNLFIKISTKFSKQCSKFNKYDFCKKYHNVTNNHKNITLNKHTYDLN